MTDGRWILDQILGSAMRCMPGTGSVGFQPRTDLASAAMAATRDSGDEQTRSSGPTPHATDDEFDPKLRATTEMILAMPVDDRLRQLEAESRFFSSIRPIKG